MSYRNAVAAGSSLFAILMLAACASDATPQSFDARLKPLYEDAVAQSAAPQALDVLRSAVTEGHVVTFEEVREAQFRAVACLEDMGLNVKTSDDAGSPGGVFLMYALPGHDGDLPADIDAAALACQERDSVLVDMAYQMTHTRAPEALEDAFAPYRDAMISCVENRGGVIDSDATARDILRIAAENDRDGGYGEACTTKLGIDTLLEQAS